MKRLLAHPLGFTAPLVLWTLFLWVSRLRNAFADDELIGSERRVALTVAGVFVVGALVVGALVVRRRINAQRLTDADEALIAGFAVASIGWWLVRAVQIALADHSVGFIIVHVILGGGTIAFAALTLRGLRSRR